MTDDATDGRRSASPSPSILRAAGDGWLEPTGLANGPWYPGTQHGSAMLGVLARAAEGHPSERPMHTTRLTCDLLRAAPMAPVRTEVRVLRAGRSVEVLEIDLLAAEDGGLGLFARASAMRIRVGDFPVPADAGGDGIVPALPDPTHVMSLPHGGGGDGAGGDGREREAFHQALEMRPVPGLERPACWFRLRVPFVEGEATSPAVRTAAIADFTYSVPTLQRAFADRAFRPDRAYVTINADTSIQLHRPMQGEWLCVDTRVYADAGGCGGAHGVLSDGRGVIGQASQSLLVRGIEARPAVWDEFEG